LNINVIDLTRPLDENTPIYSELDGFRDPAFGAEAWATHVDQGYSVHRLEIGTHTGTHVDAPVHFHPGARTMDEIPAWDLVGAAVVIDVRTVTRVDVTYLGPYAARVHAGGIPLFLAPEDGVLITEGAVDVVATWNPRILLYAGQFLDERKRYHHNRTWLGADIPLVTDLDPQTAAQVQDDDLLVVAPLPLTGMDGSPCRVLAIRGFLHSAK
jgi:kynurenine formamidase